SRWALLTDREIFRRYKRIRAPRHAGLGIPVRDVLDLRPEDYVVHEEHGIAQFVRLARLKVDEKEGEFIELRFADQGKLYVPVDNVHLIGRYVAGSEQPPKLSKLGSKVWENTKRRAQEAIEEMSGELLELYARRSVAQGMAFSKDSPWQREFEASFVYNETPDQLRSIEEVKKDMESPKPMDRLLCGDVGFGKTEVALRAAFKSVMEGKQVAVLVPTTILAQQHYRTFAERMADYPIEIRDLSRFRSAAEQKETVRELAQAKADIVIGTHRLLSSDVKFRDLGLLIVDEEQRFGVKHKERLKQMKTSVDVLTLTATPIPRTLYLSLSGLRDMSQLSVPPEDRLPVLTYVVDFKAPVIESAILREMARGGQIYFLHNRVQTIGSMANYVQKLVPDARIAVAHGQMPEKQLERLMMEFVEGQYDVLVCTTIIESGLDIPNVNTILINRADMFGLADLYQLRGRVGRERHQAYCYLLVPGTKAITPQAR
ncbi:MAG TPA: CarD family transcriptional regulator, partial [bacterium]|nr:CarD family transcriptional regulator [bacterium]